MNTTLTSTDNNTKKMELILAIYEDHIVGFQNINVNNTAIG